LVSICTLTASPECSERGVSIDIPQIRPLDDEPGVSGSKVGIKAYLVLDIDRRHTHTHDMRWEFDGTFHAEPERAIQSMLDGNRQARGVV
jgi:hypothetical protein